MKLMFKQLMCDFLQDVFPFKFSFIVKSQKRISRFQIIFSEHLNSLIQLFYFHH